MNFTTTIGRIHFSLDNISSALNPYTNDPDTLYEHAKLDVRKNGLHSPEYEIEYNLRTLASLQDEAKNFPNLYIVISPSYDRWDLKNMPEKGIFDIVIHDEVVYNAIEPKFVLAFLAGLRHGTKLNN
jgi:hypothetical protein